MCDLPGATSPDWNPGLLASSSDFFLGGLWRVPRQPLVGCDPCCGVPGCGAFWLPVTRTGAVPGVWEEGHRPSAAHREESSRSGSRPLNGSSWQMFPINLMDLSQCAAINKAAYKGMQMAQSHFREHIVTCVCMRVCVQYSIYCRGNKRLNLWLSK